MKTWEIPETEIPFVGQADPAWGQDLKVRTRNFSLGVIRLVEGLSNTRTADVIGKQVLRSATSVGAHYREACRSKSNADFISKIEGGLQEAEETSYWIELLDGAGLGGAELKKALLDEANQLIAIFVSMVRKVKSSK